MAATGYYESWLTGPGITWLSPETKYSEQAPSSNGYWCSSVTFNFDQGGYKYYSQACYVDVYCGDEFIGTFSWTGAEGQRLNQTMYIPYSPTRIGKQLHYTMTQSGFRNLVVEQVTVSNVPYLLVQPAINSQTKYSGNTTTVTCTAPSWENGTGGTEYIQWFCGTGTAYTDAYHVGTTTNYSFTFTREMLQNKGATEGQMMYLYCRAYYDKNGLQYGWDAVPYTGYLTFKDDATIKYYHNSQWIQCIPYVYHNNQWIQCEPYEYHNNQWILCSHNV